MSDPNPSPHHHYESSPAASFSTPPPPPPAPSCANCGGPTCRPSPPTPAPWSELSPPPAYRPIRAPAINAPMNSAAIILSPVPQPLPTPVLTPPYHFQTPTKRITNIDDIKHFNESPSGRHFLGFVASLSYSVRGRKLSDELPVPLSPVLASLVQMLWTLLEWVDQIPPLPHQARYGNPAYRLWHERLAAEVSSLIKPVLSTAGLEEAEVELVPYLLDSFGNATRIDYGTGHETNFAALLYCLACLNLIKEEDYPGVVTRVFITYLELMRKLQMTYCLEPAGSHGVWGLDDYHFLPFIFGAAQLIDHKYMKPKSIHNPDILENFSNEYMYLACVSFVKKAKKGVFAEHSPMLDDISGVPQWSKVNSGLLKMYKAEVLEKVPIMQHFLFGSIIKWE